MLYLAAHHGELIPKATLIPIIGAGGPDGEWRLAGCVRELRRALGDLAQEARYIQAARGHGYRLIGEIPGLRMVGDSGFGTIGNRQSSGGAHEPETDPVSHPTECARLVRYFDIACRGLPQVVFLTGPAGAGKSVLLDSFQRLLRSSLTASTSAAGADPLSNLFEVRLRCLPPTHKRASLPVLEGIVSLTRTSGGEVTASDLSELTPHWIPDGDSLLAAGAPASRRRPPSARTTRLFRDLCSTLDKLTDRAPVVVAIEDLHWGDAGIVGMLSTLARTPRPARLMVVASYRPGALPGEHTLPAVRTELLHKRLAREIELDG